MMMRHKFCWVKEDKYGRKLLDITPARQCIFNATASLWATGKNKAMKKLITTALIISALSVFAEIKPTPAVPCDCVGIGMPESPTQKINSKTFSSNAKLHPMGLGEYLFYEARLGWLLFLLY
jgi:hypothetical protein